jgi:hypothetical protein
MNSTWMNRRVVISANDLLEGGRSGRVIADKGRAIAVELSGAVLLSDGRACSHLVASVRHENRTLEEIMEGTSVLCALTLVPDENFDIAKPCDVSWWRGGGAVIGDIRAEITDR